VKKQAKKKSAKQRDVGRNKTKKATKKSVVVKSDRKGGLVLE